MLRMLGWSLLMILAFGGLLSGLAFGLMRPSNQPLGFTAAFACGVLAAVSLKRLVALNRAYLESARREVLAHPERILARWNDAGRDVIIARDALLIDRAHHPFDAWYCTLKELRRSSSGLCFAFRRGAAGRHWSYTVELTLPPEPQAAQLLEGLREGGLL